MDAVVKHLRDGRIQEDGPAPLVVISDSLEAIGGPAVFNQVRSLTLSPLGVSGDGMMDRGMDDQMGLDFLT